MSASRAVNERLLRLLLRDEDPGAELVRARDGAGWEDLVALLDHHRLLAFARPVLSLHSDRIPAVVLARLRRASADALMLNEAVARDGEAVLRALQSRGIMAAPLKGPWLAERFEAGYMRRVTHDLDLLVPEPSMRPATGVLLGMGYRLSLERSEFDSRSIHVAFVAADPGRWTERLELHQRVVDVDSSSWMEGLWRRAERRGWRGLEITVLSATDTALTLSVHAFRHLWGHLSHVLDLAMAVRVDGDRIDWDLLVTQALEARIGQAVGRSLALAASLCAIAVPHSVLLRLERAGPRRMLAGALLSRRGVIRPRPPLLWGPYAALIRLASDDHPARRRIILGRVARRCDRGRSGVAATRLWGLLGRTMRLGAQTLAAIRP